MNRALRIDADGTSNPYELPEDDCQTQVLRDLVGGDFDRAVYHRRVLIHVHGGAPWLPMNLAAWALASAWRGLLLPCGLYGPAVITGPLDARERVTGLEGHLMAQARAAASAVMEVVAELAEKPPESDDVAKERLYDAARRLLT